MRLGVVQHRGGRVERERPVGLDARVVPALLFLEVGHEHVVGEDVPERQVVVLRLASCASSSLIRIGSVMSLALPARLPDRRSLKRPTR